MIVFIMCVKDCIREDSNLTKKGKKNTCAFKNFSLLMYKFFEMRNFCMSAPFAVLNIVY